MIDKVQYTDYNRFLVSTGYVLIAVGLLLPYFYLRENFDLQIEVAKIQQLTPIAKQIINEKHQFSLWLIKIIPGLSLTCVLAGLIFLFIGGNRWRKRQRIEDEKMNEEVIKLKTENKKAVIELERSLNAEKVSEEEDLQNKENEIQQEQPSITTSERKLSAQAYFVIERLLAEKFKNAFSDKYNVLTNYRINNLEFDIILSAINYKKTVLDLSKDIIVEIKYTSKIITPQYVINTLERTDKLMKNYPKAITNPIVIFVTDDASLVDEEFIRREIVSIWSEKTINKWNLIFVDLKQLGEINLKDRIRI